MERSDTYNCLSLTYNALATPLFLLSELPDFIIKATAATISNRTNTPAPIKIGISKDFFWGAWLFSAFTFALAEASLDPSFTFSLAEVSLDPSFTFSLAEASLASAFTFASVEASLDPSFTFALVEASLDLAFTSVFVIGVPQLSQNCASSWSSLLHLLHTFIFISSF